MKIISKHFCVIARFFQPHFNTTFCCFFLEVTFRSLLALEPRKGPWPKGLSVCVFANGCFWGSEKGIWRLPGGGIFSTAVGYAGGYTPNPTYEEACSGRTGHTEAVQVVFDPEKISLVDILRWFWEAHDPTQGFLVVGFGCGFLLFFCSRWSCVSKNGCLLQNFRKTSNICHGWQAWVKVTIVVPSTAVPYTTSDEEQRQLYEASCTAYEQAPEG